MIRGIRVIRVARLEMRPILNKDEAHCISDTRLTRPLGAALRTTLGMKKMNANRKRLQLRNAA